MGFQTLPPSLIRLLLVHEQDYITEAAAKQDRAIRTMPCMRCGSAMEPTMYGPDTFDSETSLPKVVARCVECGCVVNPKNGIVYDTGDPTKIEDALPLIRPSED